MSRKQLVWTDRRGIATPIKELGTSHLINIIDYLRSTASQRRGETLASLRLEYEAQSTRAQRTLICEYGRRLKGLTDDEFLAEFNQFFTPLRKELMTRIRRTLRTN